VATVRDIQEEIQKISEKWENPSARNGLFGNILKSLTMKEIRGIEASLEFSWPITVIAGTNGSGKTTMLQLCSAAYKQKTGGRHYKIGEWIRGALSGETPAFNEKSTVSFSFWDDTQGITIPYQKDRTRWGYPRRKNPERHVEFFGITTFAPRIERKDRLHVFRSKLEIKETTKFSSELLQSISKVLGITYLEGSMHKVGLAKGGWSDLLPQITKADSLYAEPHMGAGEQKVIRLIQALEAIPNKSLVLLEEPEITLHPDAQRGLAWYLMSLCRRKGHQIIVATHSAELFETLPSSARILLLRKSKNIEVLPRAPYITAARELAGVVKTNKDLILVEDIVGKVFLTEILRRYDKTILDNSVIVPVGNTDDVYRMVKSFRDGNVRAIGVRDPDIGDDKHNGIFSLPGDQAPESLLLHVDNIKNAEGWINGISDAFGRAKARGIGLTGSKWAKAVFAVLPHEVGCSIDHTSDRLTLSWLASNEEIARRLAKDIRQAFECD
jgi:predicted ATPase